MFSSSTNILNYAKIVIVLAIVATVYITFMVSRPIYKENTTIVEPPKNRDLLAEHVRMYDLNKIARMNSHRLPGRSKNISARDICKRKYTCAPQHRRYETMLRVSPKYKMVNCVVQKSMSTMMTGAMCYLYNEEEFEKTGRNFDDEFNGRMCKEHNEFSSVSAVRDAYNISVVKTDWSLSMVTRDPIDRFVSGYVDRCVRIRNPNITEQCNGCGINMTCFIETEYKRLMEISFKRRLHRTMEDAHFFPQIWHCDLNEELEFFEFVPYSSDSERTMLPQLKDLMKRQKVPRRSIDFISNQLSTRRPTHATSGTPAKRFYYTRLMSSPYLLEFIVKMFYYDFIELHYSFPPGF